MLVTQFTSWEFRATPPAVQITLQGPVPQWWRPAQVPGHVHLDLVANEVLADPFRNQHELAAQWVDQETWEYRTRFDWSPREELPRRVLRFEGLDSVGEIFLNGESLGRFDNMHLPVERDVTDRLRVGDNELMIRFESAVKVGLDRRRDYFEQEQLPWDLPWFDERAFVRKAAYMSGWDWGPRLVSCGIWRPALLLEFAARMIDFQIFTQKLNDGRWKVWSRTTVEGDAELAVTLANHTRNGDFELIIDDPNLWWPNGEGDPFLYPAAAELSSGHAVLKWFGLREIRLVRESDEHGESFEFEVNGRRIFGRGANWIPNDSFPSRVSEEDFDDQMEVAAALGFNMIRIWGGGLYAEEAFYDACDRHGILVWQDFPYGCSYYPDDDAFADAARIEAEHHVKALRHHASLALWCGNNENETMWEGKWGGADDSPPRYYGESLYAEVFAKIVAEQDPQTTYIRTSPVNGTQMEPNVNVNAGGSGDQHNWDVWHGSGDYTRYANSTARFCSEFGFASSCNLITWKQALDRLDVSVADPHVVYHNRTGKREADFVSYVQQFYPECHTLEDWVYFSQLNQRDALRFGIEHYRTSGYCRGTLIWQMNDCWPTESWAVQDYGRWLKPAGFELARLYAPRMVSVRVLGEHLEIRLANETTESVRETVRLDFYGMDGQPVGSTESQVEVSAKGVAYLEPMEFPDGDPATRVVRAQLVGVKGSITWRTLRAPKEMRWETPSVSRTATGLRVSGLAYDLVVTQAETHRPLAFDAWFLRGLEAGTRVDEELRLPPGATGRLYWRCLGGRGLV